MDQVKNIISLTGKQKYPITLMHAVSLVISLLFYGKVHATLDKIIGQSLILEKMKSGFDKTIFWDIWNEHPQVVNDIFQLFGILFVVYLFISIVINGGMLSNIFKSNFTVNQMIKSGVAYFLPFLLIAMVSLFVLFLSLGILWYLYLKILGNPLEDYTTELPFVYSLLFMIFLSLFAMGKVWAFSVLWRISYIKTGQLLSSFKEAVLLLKSKIWKILLIWFILIILGFIISCTFTLVNASNSSLNIVLVVLTIVLMQGILWMRSYVKTLGYVTLNELVFKA